MAHNCEGECNRACNKCQSGCNGSQGCLTCLTCNEGCELCNDSQTVCDLNTDVLKDLVGTQFKFTVPPEKDRIQIGPKTGMFTRDVWNEAAKYLNQRHSYGSEDWETGGSAVSDYEGNLFTFGEFNRISGIVGGPTVSQYQPIKASLFDTLKTNINKYKISSDACDQCNNGCQKCVDGCEECDSGCNVSCKGCNDCDSSCESCKGCNDCVTGESQTPTTS